ncbi:hypothetical protein ACN47E_009432 [Coniothyrium glycines]
MFKQTAALQKQIRRLPLSPKQAGKEYYKGNRVGSMGTINKYGNFIPDWSKIRTYVYPINGTKSCELTPFVAANTEKARRNDVTDAPEPYPKRFTGEDYLRSWKLMGGHDIVEAPEESQARRNMPEPFEERPATKE